MEETKSNKPSQDLKNLPLLLHVQGRLITLPRFLCVRVSHFSLSFFSVFFFFFASFIFFSLSLSLSLTFSTLHKKRHHSYKEKNDRKDSAFKERLVFSSKLQINSLSLINTHPRLLFFLMISLELKYIYVYNFKIKTLFFFLINLLKKSNIFYNCQFRKNCTH